MYSGMVTPQQTRVAEYCSCEVMGSEVQAPNMHSITPAVLFLVEGFDKPAGFDFAHQTFIKKLPRVGASGFGFLG